MKKRIFTVFISLACVLSVIGPAFADDTAKKNTSQAPQLVALLPASDGIMTLDVRRLLNDALPQILSANQPKLGQIMGKIDEVKTKTGIDLKRFEQVAVGIRNKQVSATKIDFEPVILARGTYDAGQLVELAKLASKGEYREEKIGDRTIYVFSPKEMVKDNQPPPKSSFPGKLIDKMLINLDGEFALASYDVNTLVLGSLPRVRETLEGKTRVNDQLLELVYRDQTAVMSFGANMPAGMSRILDLDNAEIDKNIDVIKQIYGTMNVTGTSTNVLVTARASKADQAKELETFMKSMAEIGRLLIGGTKGADKQVYARMLDNARISRTGNEVMLDLQVPQSDVDILLGEKK